MPLELESLRNATASLGEVLKYSEDAWLLLAALEARND